MYVDGLSLNPLNWFKSAPTKIEFKPLNPLVPMVKTAEEMGIRTDIISPLSTNKIQLAKTAITKTGVKLISPTMIGGKPVTSLSLPKTTPKMALPSSVNTTPLITAPTTTQVLTTTPSPAASTQAETPKPSIPKGTTLNTILAGGLAVAAALFLPRGSSGGSAPSAGSAYAPTTSQNGNPNAPAVATPGTVAPSGGAYIDNGNGTVTYVPAGTAIEPGTSYVPAEQYTQDAAKQALSGGISPWLIAAAIGGVALIAFVPKKNSNTRSRSYRRTPAARTRSRRYA